MGKSTTFSGQLLALIFNGTAIPNLATNTSTSPLTSLYVSLHTADPTASGTQSSNEVAYTGYARVAVGRTSAAFAQSGAQVAPVANIIFPAPTAAATQTATFWAVGVASSGASTILYSGPISPSIAITVGLPPSLSTASTITES